MKFASNPQLPLTKWDEHFLRMAKEAATMSKDPSTQVGAILTDSFKRIVGTGYNGFPRGVKDTEERLINREIKYELVVHAEVNAILNSNVLPRGATLYCTAFPCPRCTGVLIQSGIQKVIALPKEDYDTRMAKMIALSREMLTEAGIPYFHLSEGYL